MQFEFDERLPVPTRSTLIVDGLLHPEAAVLDPLSPGATTEIVTAGVVPVPW
jgi:hypothetical protein